MNKDIIPKWFYTIVCVAILGVIISVVAYAMKNTLHWSEAVLKCVKNLGSYSVAITSFFVYYFYAEHKRKQEQIINDSKDEQEKAKQKIANRKNVVASIGHSYFTFPPSDIIDRDCSNSPIIGQPTNVIFTDKDFEKAIKPDLWEIKSYTQISLSDCKIMKCYSTKGDAILKNIIVWNDDCFNKEKENIIKNYFEICEKINFCGVICLNTSSARASYLTICGLLPNGNPQQFILTAITNNGYLVMIKIKYKLQTGGAMQILQQLQYYLEEDDFQSLV